MPRVIKQPEQKKRVLVTSLQPKDEALRAAALFFDRYSGIDLRPPTSGETAAQYRAYVMARITPSLTSAANIKKIVKAAIQS